MLLISKWHHILSKMALMDMFSLIIRNQKFIQMEVNNAAIVHISFGSLARYSSSSTYTFKLKKTPVQSILRVFKIISKQIKRPRIVLSEMWMGCKKLF